MLAHIFEAGFSEGADTVCFERGDLVSAADALNISLPKNLGDTIYSVRFRTTLPQSILDSAPKGKVWIIRLRGRARYCFELVDPELANFVPNKMLAVTKIPNATPGLIAAYALSSEQALLAVLRYNRLIDIFTGVTCYSLQSHLRTTAVDVGQVETDEVYIGVDRHGAQYVFPVQAKGGTDKLGVVQVEQDIAMCAEKFTDLVCRPVAAQFMNEDTVALFEFEVHEGSFAGLRQERHFQLVPFKEVNTDDLELYQQRLRDAS